MADSIAIVYALLAILGLKICTYLLSRGKTQAPYPPGPKPKPLVGNMFDLPLSNPCPAYMGWGKKYNSPILYAEALGNRVLILNDREDAIELFEQRARIYSDRPLIPIVKLMGWQYNFALLEYGEEWRLHRKISQQNFNLKASERYKPIQAKKVYQLLQALHKSPEDFDAHNRKLSVSITMEMMYGLEIKSVEDPCIAIADEAIRLGTELLLPGNSLINTFPVLRHIPAWVPGAWSMKQAKRVSDLTEEMMRIPMDQVKTAFKEGKAVPSFFTDFFEKKQTSGTSEEEEQVVQNIAYTVYGAASDTTISATGFFFYYMAANPHVQKKAQAEIDRLTGLKRLPTLDDRKSLPYVEAIYRELMRLGPPLPLGLPHGLIEDDYYKGYFIPKAVFRTAVFANIWGMSRDESVYHDASSFNPDRFLDENGKLNDDDRILAYGFGRRICVGKHVASSTMWLIIASVIACFNIGKAKDSNGNDIEINDEIEDLGLMNQKAKFLCSIKARSPAVEKLILDGH